MAQSQELCSQSASQEGSGVVQNPNPSPNPMAALYVGDLDTSVSESQLFEMFTQVGNVISVRVCRDVRTRNSLGYAYVNFSDSAEAAKAIETLNFTPLNGKPIRVMYSNRDASTRIIADANLYVKNIDKSVTNIELYKKFSLFGSILSCKLVTEPNGQSKGYGFVQFDSIENAQNAIKNLNGTLMKEKNIFVGPFKPKTERETSPEEDSSKFKNVFVKNLSETTSEDDLREIFGAFGKIASVVVMRDEEGKSKCFGFVNFERGEDAILAVEGLNGKKFEEREWFVGKAMKKWERERDIRERLSSESVNLQDGDANNNTNNSSNNINNNKSNLYLKNLDESIEDDKLRELFADFGTITSCKVMRDENGRSKGTGFVNFESHDSAAKALESMAGKLVGTKPLYIAFAEKKEERRARFQERFSNVNPVAPMPMFPHQHLPPQFFYGQHPAFLPPQGGYGGYQQQGGMRPGSPMMNMSPNLSPRGPRPNRQGYNNSNNNSGYGPHMHYNNNQRPFPSSQGYGSRGYNNRNYNGNANGNGHGYNNNNRNYNDNNKNNNNNNNNTNRNYNGNGNGNGNWLRKEGTLASALAKSTPEQQRLMLGDTLFPLVMDLEPEFASKITGMLLEMDKNEILHLLESPDALRLKVNEAKNVLRNHQLNNPLVLPSNEFASLSLNDSTPIGAV